MNMNCKVAPVAPTKNTYFECFEVCKNFKSMIFVGAIGANYYFLRFV